ncbi:MAG: hypothetical protein Q8R86_06215 [Sulfuricurvum sp.]|nr:hypothetical protein [Sulfuricurvum sp.]
MKQNNRQTSPLGKSTKADNAGLSLLQLPLFSYEGQVIKYYNEPSFITRLKTKKFRNTILDFQKYDGEFRIFISQSRNYPFVNNLYQGLALGFNNTYFIAV